MRQGTEGAGEEVQEMAGQRSAAVLGGQCEPHKDSDV